MLRSALEIVLECGKRGRMLRSALQIVLDILHLHVLCFNADTNGQALFLKVCFFLQVDDRLSHLLKLDDNAKPALQSRMRWGLHKIW